MRVFLPVLVVLLCPLSALAQKTLTERDYRALIQEYRAATQKPITAAQAAAWKRRWETIAFVRCDDGRRLQPDHRAEIDSMAAAVTRARGKENVRASLETRARIDLRAWLLQEATVPTRTVDSAALAKQILADKEYEKARRKAQESPVARWIREHWEAFARWLRTLVPERQAETRDFAGAAGIVRAFLYVLAGAAVVGGLWLIVRQGPGRSGSVRKRRLPPGEREDLIAAHVPDPLEAARNAAAAGEFRLAVRLLYIACLRRLSEASLLTLERHRTNGEYQALLERRDSQVAALLLPATRLYERIWYGGERADQDDIDRLLALYATLPEAPR